MGYFFPPSQTNVTSAGTKPLRVASQITVVSDTIVEVQWSAAGARIMPKQKEQKHLKTVVV